MYKKFNCLQKILRCNFLNRYIQIGFCLHLGFEIPHSQKGKIGKKFIYGLFWDFGIWQPSNSNSEVLHIRCRRCCWSHHLCALFTSNKSRIFEVGNLTPHRCFCLPNLVANMHENWKFNKAFKSRNLISQNFFPAFYNVSKITIWCETLLSRT